MACDERSSDIGRFLASAGSLTDPELAVAIQGLLCRRPSARRVLQSVWRAEDAVGDVAARAVASTAAARPHDGAAGRLQACARRFAAHGSAESVGTEHVLAAALALFPREAALALGPALHAQLVELLGKSGLAPPPASGRTGDGLGFDADIAPLLAAVDVGQGQAELFSAFQALPDSSSATQLLEMAKIFLERSDPIDDSESMPCGDDAHRGVNGLQQLRRGAQRCAAQGGASQVGDQHVLASALHLWPEAALEAFGELLRDQLVELLEKSSLTVPVVGGDNSFGAALAFEEQAEVLCLATQNGVLIFDAVKQLPDSCAASQLVAMATLFAEHAKHLQ